ncbi:MAG: M28 family peptidase [Candidatus Zixiibacteriota bacterium]
MFHRLEAKMIKSGFVFLLSLLCTCSSSSRPKFDGKEAFGYLMDQCDLGPRNPGSEGHQRCRKYLLDKLKRYTNLVKTQEFVYQDTSGKTKLELTNIIVSFYPEEEQRMLLCTHWDTRPTADQDPDPSLRGKPILGANDGGSGVAVLLEIAGIISQKKPKWGVDIILFDGEDYGPEHELEKFCLGSKYFAKNKGEYKPEFGILLDMVGDKDLEIYKEGYSTRYAEKVVDLVWSAAQRLEIDCFHDSTKYFMYDDHVPLLEVGIPCINLIDYDYPYWHTTQDTPDKCSPESLQKIGEVLIEILYR